MTEFSTEFDEVPEDEFCVHGIYPKESCTICNGKDKVKLKIEYKFRAKSNYSCFDCKEPISTGDPVARLSNDRIIGEECFHKYTPRKV